MMKKQSNVNWLEYVKPIMIYFHILGFQKELPMDTIAREQENTNFLEGKSFRRKKMGIGLEKEVTLKLKFLIHFIKGKISFTPVELILTILGELEYLEGLVKLAKKQKK